MAQIHGLPKQDEVKSISLGIIKVLRKNGIVLINPNIRLRVTPNLPCHLLTSFSDACKPDPNPESIELLIEGSVSIIEPDKSSPSKKDIKIKQLESDLKVAQAKLANLAEMLKHA